jgi:MFS family permease
MNLKERLGKRIRGWLPKELSLPRNQKHRMVDHTMRLQLLRVAYGVMLGTLLFTPFGVYHSRVEPYIIGYLWGYHLPVGYVGVLLGIVAVLYPRLNRLRSVRFSAFMPFIGLSLFLTFLFSPQDYFINLINGTNFSPAQIDVDFAVGNAAVLYLSILSIVLGLASFIRGWLPKEPNVPNVPSNKMQEADAKNRFPKPRWWKPFWRALVAIAVIFVVINYFVFHYPLSSVIGGLAITLLGIGAAYYIRIRPSLRVNRAVYVFLGCGISVVLLVVVYGISGLGRWVTDTLGPWPSLIIGYAVFIPLGVLIGDWIGKRRNYQLPLSP